MYPPLLVFITGKGPLKSYYQDMISKMDFSRVNIHLPWLADEEYPKLLGNNWIHCGRVCVTLVNMKINV